MNWLMDLLFTNHKKRALIGSISSNIIKDDYVYKQFINQKHKQEFTINDLKICRI